MSKKIKLPGHIKRIISEAFDLREKMKKLKKALSDKEFTEQIRKEQLELLTDQLEVMEIYYEILEKRIDNNSLIEIENAFGKLEPTLIRITKKNIFVYETLEESASALFKFTAKRKKDGRNEK